MRKFLFLFAFLACTLSYAQGGIAPEPVQVSNKSDDDHLFFSAGSALLVGYNTDTLEAEFTVDEDHGVLPDDYVYLSTDLSSVSGVRKVVSVTDDSITITSKQLATETSTGVIEGTIKLTKQFDPGATNFRIYDFEYRIAADAAPDLDGLGPSAALEAGLFVLDFNPSNQQVRYIGNLKSIFDFYNPVVETTVHSFTADATRMIIQQKVKERYSVIIPKNHVLILLCFDDWTGIDLFSLTIGGEPM